MIGGDGKMEEEKNNRGFGVERVYRNVGGEKMEKVKSKPIDFVGEVIKEFGLEDMEIIRQEAGFDEEEKTTLYEVMDMIWVYGQSTGGFCLQVEKSVPEFIVIKYGHRPNEFSKYSYSLGEVLFTDGDIVFISRMVDTDGNTRYDVYYKYKLINAKFALVFRYEENNFSGYDQQFLAIRVYGGDDKLINVLRRLNDLLSI
jgi:hypothetical protein